MPAVSGAVCSQGLPATLRPAEASIIWGAIHPPLSAVADQRGGPAWSVTAYERQRTMKTGLSLTQLAQELERQATTKRDFLAPERQLQVEVVEADTPTVHLVVGAVGRFPLTPYAHGQVGEHLGIPKAYYERLLQQAPDLLATNVNHWLHASAARRLLRTLDSAVRAYLSHRYRPLDHQDLAEAVLPVLLEDPQLEVASCAITATRLYLKVTTARLTAEVRKGDIVQAGLVISNSEVGAGSVRVEPLLYRLACLNGAIINDLALKKYHVGRANGHGEDAIQAFLRDETKALNDRAFWATVQDVVRGTLQEVTFAQIVARWRETTQEMIAGDPAQVVEVTAKRLGLTEPERGSVLRHLVEGGDLSRYGLANALTRASQDVDDYDRATDLERLGGQLIELPRQAWQTLATAT